MSKGGRKLSLWASMMNSLRAESSKFISSILSKALGSTVTGFSVGLTLMFEISLLNVM